MTSQAAPVCSSSEVFLPGLAQQWSQHLGGRRCKHAGSCGKSGGDCHGEMRGVPWCSSHSQTGPATAQFDQIKGKTFFDDTAQQGRSPGKQRRLMGRGSVMISWAGKLCHDLPNLLVRSLLLPKLYAIAEGMCLLEMGRRHSS